MPALSIWVKAAMTSMARKTMLKRPSDGSRRCHCRNHCRSRTTTWKATGISRFWETAQDLEMPVAFHVVVRDRQWFRQWQRRDPSDGLFSIVFLAIDVMAAFTQMLSAGMFERYPRLRCVVLEAGSNWIAAWLDRLDHKYRVLAHQTPIRMPPSEYFRRQCLISADPDESVTAQMVEHLGADYFVWASDYPHIDASFGVVRELKERLAPLPEEARRKVLGLNARRFYRLSD